MLRLLSLALLTAPAAAELQLASAASAAALGRMAAGAAAPVVGRTRLGAEGPEVSRVAYGTLHLHEAGSAQGALRVLQKAVGLGITTFDLSDVYNQQPELFGAALQLEPGLREQVEVIAKMDIVPALGGFGFDAGSAYDTSASHLDQVLDRYLKALNTTYLDVVMLHRQDYLLDVDDLADTFGRWLREGRARYVGVSNFDRAAFELLSRKVPLVANEIELSPLNPAALYDGRVSFHYGAGSGVLAWSPLGGDPWGGPNRLFKVGSLDGTGRGARIKGGLATVGQQLGCGPDVAAVAWLLRHPAKIVPILGTMNLDRLESQAKAVSLAGNMTRQQWYHVADACGVPIY